jgi:tetratricopeptide (TPR) repeat protein
MHVNCDPIANRLTFCVFAAALATAVGGDRLRAQDSPCSKQRAVTGDRSQLEACRAMVATEPSNADARNALAIARAQANDYPGAISAWRAYLRLRPTDYEAYQNLGLMYEISQQPDSALVAFRAVLELPADPATVQNASWHIGVAYANTGRDRVVQRGGGDRLDGCSSMALRWADGVTSQAVSRSHDLLGAYGEIGARPSQSNGPGRSRLL